jgi:apolipoprotein N-acyltransferase
VIDFAGHRVAVLICYEQVIVWPILQSVWHHPDVLVAVANDWWARDTTIPGVQLNSARAWAKLFDLPLAVAFNY